MRVIRKHIRIRHCQAVNNQLEPFLKGDAMERLLKPRISEEDGVLFLVLGSKCEINDIL